MFVVLPFRHPCDLENKSLKLVYGVKLNAWMKDLVNVIQDFLCLSSVKAQKTNAHHYTTHNFSCTFKKCFLKRGVEVGKNKIWHSQRRLFQLMTLFEIHSPCFLKKACTSFNFRSVPSVVLTQDRNDQLWNIKPLSNAEPWQTGQKQIRLFYVPHSLSRQKHTWIT